MQVILTTEVLGLGDPGEIVTVKNGYGRNYLVPRGMAIEATSKNIKAVEAERQRIAKLAAKEADQVKAEADGMAGLVVTLEAKAGETGKLYGSVTNMDIAAKMAEMGLDVDRRRIIMEEGPLKSLGEYEIPVKLHPHVVVNITVMVEPEPGSPAAQPAEKAEEAALEAAGVAEEGAEEAGQKPEPEADTEAEDQEGEPALEDQEPPKE